MDQCNVNLGVILVRSVGMQSIVSKIIQSRL